MGESDRDELKRCLPLLHSTSWKLSLHFVHVFRKGWNFFTKLGSTDPNFNRSIWYSYTWSLKYPSMRKLQLFITTYYLQVSWHDMDLKLTFGCFLINKVAQWFYQLDHVTFSKKCILVCKFCTVFCQICYVQKSILRLV